MKFSVYMTDTTAMHEAVQKAVEEEVKKLGLPADESQALTEIKWRKELENMDRWFAGFGAYLGVDFDTETMTATVREQKR